MTENYEVEIISYLREENQRLTRAEKDGVSKCLGSKGHKPTKQDIAICISEARRRTSKMNSETRGPDITTLPASNRKTIEL